MGNNLVPNLTIKIPQATIDDTWYRGPRFRWSDMGHRVGREHFKSIKNTMEFVQPAQPPPVFGSLTQAKASSLTIDPDAYEEEEQKQA
jgi:hypothetical protein